VNSTLRCAEGRGEEPLRLDTPRCHPTPMLTETMVAAATRQHMIHDGLKPCQPECLEIAVRVLSASDLGMETGGGEDVVRRWVEWVGQESNYVLPTRHRATIWRHSA